MSEKIVIRKPFLLNFLLILRAIFGIFLAWDIVFQRVADATLIAVLIVHVNYWIDKIKVKQ